MQFPSDLPGGNAWGWVFGNSPIILLHIIIGTLLIVVALVALILGLAARHTAWVITAVAGLAMLIVSWLSGAAFLRSQDNGTSLTMALTFIGALVAYLLGYYLSGVRAQKQTA